MSSKLARSWRALVLAWAVLLAPQVSMVHALSHSLPGGAQHTGESDKRKQAPAKVCDSCLALAQLGAALPASFVWVSVGSPAPVRPGAVWLEAIASAATGYDARAPPAELS